MKVKVVVYHFFDYPNLAGSMFDFGQNVDFNRNLVGSQKTLFRRPFRLSGSRRPFGLSGSLRYVSSDDTFDLEPEIT